MKFEELIIKGEKEITNNLMTDNRNNINKNRNWLNIKDYSNENNSEKIINDIVELEKSNNKPNFLQNLIFSKVLLLNLTSVEENSVAEEQLKIYYIADLNK